MTRAHERGWCGHGWSVECNKRKANRSLINTGMSLRRPPNVPRWSWDVEIAIGRRRASWGHFLSDRYWNVELTD